MRQNGPPRAEGTGRPASAAWPAPPPLDGSLTQTASALRDRRLSAVELCDAAIRRHEAHGEELHAYKHFDAGAVRLLVLGNWVRTAAWTARSGLLLWLAWRLL